MASSALARSSASFNAFSSAFRWASNALSRAAFFRASSCSTIWARRTATRSVMLTLSASACARLARSSLNRNRSASSASPFLATCCAIWAPTISNSVLSACFLSARFCSSMRVMLSAMASRSSALFVVSLRAARFFLSGTSFCAVFRLISLCKSCKASSCSASRCPASASSLSESLMALVAPSVRIPLNVCPILANTLTSELPSSVAPPNAARIFSPRVTTEPVRRSKVRPNPRLKPSIAVAPASVFLAMARMPPATADAAMPTGPSADAKPPIMGICEPT